jgi:hypothetical protein
MHDQAASRASVIVAMPDDVDYGRDDQACDPIHAASAAGAPVVIADFTITTFCDCAVLQRMLAVQSYAPPAALGSAWWSPPARPVRRILKSTGLEQQVPVLPPLLATRRRRA